MGFAPDNRTANNTDGAPRKAVPMGSNERTADSPLRKAVPMGSNERTADSPLRKAVPMGRAQASLELLLLFAVFLTLLGISLFSASKLNAAAQKRSELSLAERSFADFSAKLSQVCSLGNGNVRTVKIEGAKAEISEEGNALTFQAGSFAASAASSCEISVQQAAPSDRFTIRNIDGKIEISG
jgi:uncharacterized protein (UPF0333 family)